MTDFTQAIPVLPAPDWHAVAGIPIVDAGHGVPVGLRENGDGLGEVGHGVN
ncbi:hypothetical protein [Pseudomonas aeruginosa]